MSSKKNLVILGSTGSIGTQCLDIVEKNQDKFSVSVLSCNNKIDKIEEQIEKFQPKMVVVNREEDAMALSIKLVKKGFKVDFLGNYDGKPVPFYDDLEDDSQPVDIENDSQVEEKKEKIKSVIVLWGMNGLISAAKSKNHLIVNGLVGISGLKPTYEGILAGNDIALANKETLVAGGEIIMKTAKEKGVRILPVDSEHSAIFQCLRGEDKKSLHKILLTASGGPFRGKMKEELTNVSREEALNHPKWEMGAKITIDSSTLMNKGLEVIEAKWLFDVNVEDIEVIVHPQSIIHSMVEFDDGSVIAQLGNPDMRIPISYAIEYPSRLPMESDRLNLFKENNLTFEKPDFETFECLKLAYYVSKKGGAYPVVFNGANEALVELFLQGKIKYLEIQDNIKKELIELSYKEPETIEDIIEIDRDVKTRIQKRFGSLDENLGKIEVL